MKKSTLLISALMIAGFVFAQNPVSWSYSTKKISDKTYEVHILASLQPGWHLYSQKQPEDAIAIPTEIKFNKNPLLECKDKTKEIGTLQKKKEETLGIEAWQYGGKVEFVQTVKLKMDAKTAISGSVEYQVCTDEVFTAEDGAVYSSNSIKSFSYLNVFFNPSPRKMFQHHPQYT